MFSFTLIGRFWLVGKVQQKSFKDCHLPVLRWKKAFLQGTIMLKVSSLQKYFCKSKITDAPMIEQKTSAKDIKSSSRHGDAGGRAQGATGWARRGFSAAACLHSTAGTTYPPSVGGRGAALPLKPHYLHDHRGCPRSQPNLRDRNSSHEIGAILITWERPGSEPGIT